MDYDYTMRMTSAILHFSSPSQEPRLNGSGLGKRNKKSGTEDKYQKNPRLLIFLFALLGETLKVFINSYA